MENKVKNILCNTIQDLPVTLDEINNKALDDTFIKKVKD